jgi:hypothetical protein
MAGLVAVFVAGCGGPTPRGLDDDDAAVRITTMREIARTGSLDAGAGRKRVDDVTLGKLVGQLDDDDPAVRLYAIEALERLKGDTLGYQYFDDDADRAEALQRWEDWLAARLGRSPRQVAKPASPGSPTTLPAGQPATGPATSPAAPASQPR